MAHWGMACTWSSASFVLMARAVGALLDDDAEPTPSGRPEWLPPPSRLIEIASDERAWDVYLIGSNHPSLACALLYERLGLWGEASETARGLLAILVQPLARFEAHCLVARWALANGPADDTAVEALRAAAAEAAAAGYSWLELVATHELWLLGQCPDDDRRRMIERAASSDEEVDVFLESSRGR
jgi:hypothetical protein